MTRLPQRNAIAGEPPRRRFWRRGFAAFAIAIRLAALPAAWSPGLPVRSEEPPQVDVEGQPLAANAERLLEALELLGHPLPAATINEVRRAAAARDAAALQTALDRHVLVVVSLNPEIRVKASRGPAEAELQQGGYTPVLIKVVNEGAVARALHISSPQAGAPYSGASLAILKRQAQTQLENAQPPRSAAFLNVEMYRAPPLTPQLSGLEVEYAVALIYSAEAGKREATLAFDVGAGTQDLGFRGQTPVLFEIRPATPVRLKIRDFDGAPTVARLTFRDEQGRVYPPQAKRLAPDFFFQPQIYRGDGDTVLLPPGKFRLESCRGPEYRIERRMVIVPQRGPAEVDIQEIDIQLERWVEPAAYGFYSGDHHIHGAGCAHYTSPTEGVSPQDMFLQVKGEGLNVGCVLTWGPCFEFQRQYFSPQASEISQPQTILKYDLEISGFGSAALGHVCLLNLKDQTYPGSEGTKTQGWPSWTLPVMQWCKRQGGVTGYPHSALHVNAEQAGDWLIRRFDSDRDQRLSAVEAAAAVLPSPFEKIDSDNDKNLSAEELRAATDAAADALPNLALPALNGAGAMEVFVTAPAGACDFISAMDTARVSEWNTWYHLMNCGAPLKLSGETDFPCMSSRWVGQGRVYVQLGDVERVDFRDWCDGVARGRSYVSDGYAHALQFEVEGRAPGGDPLELERPGSVRVAAKVAFAPAIPRGVAYGTLAPPEGQRMAGDTVHLHAERSEDLVSGGVRRVELIVNGQAVAERNVPADGKTHSLEFQVVIERSSWVALRQFPQLHTNPVSVLVEGRPIRASRDSALWCAESVGLLWHNRHRFIAEAERPAARRAYDDAEAFYRRAAAESPDRAQP